MNILGAVLGGIKGALTGATGSAELSNAIEKVAVSVSKKPDVPLTNVDAPVVGAAIAEALPNPKAFVPLTPQVFRSVLMSLGGAMAARGYIHSGDIEMYVGAVMAVAPLAWNVFFTLLAKYSTPK